MNSIDLKTQLKILFFLWQNKSDKKPVKSAEAQKIRVNEVCHKFDQNNS